MAVNVSFHKASPTTLIKVSILMLVIGLVLGVVGTILCVNHYQKLANFIPVEGIVVDYDKKLSSNNSYDYDNYYPNDYLYAPIVEYVVGGQKYRVKENSYSNIPKKIGTKVTILYNPKNPADATFKKDSAVIAVPCVAGLFLVIGGICLICGIAEKKKVANYGI